MSRKLNKLLSLSSSSSSSYSTITTATATNNPSSSPWQWPYCYQPRTLSFRHDTVFKTLNSVAYLDDACDAPSTITTLEDEDSEAIVESLVSRERMRSRLFFEPGESNSILLDFPSRTDRINSLDLKISEQKHPTTETETEIEIGTETETEGEAKSANTNVPVFKEMRNSVVLAMDSRDPFEDFRKSMEEMVEAHRLKDSSSNNNSTSLEFLQELLCWYLRANEKTNHGYIYGAFVDLLVNIQHSASASASCFCSQSPSSPLSDYISSSISFSSSVSTPCVSESDSGGGDHSELIKSRPRSSR